jgi:hypothetical protein
MVKTVFGNVVSRALSGGVHLTALEAALLQRLVAELPDRLRSTVEAQFAAYDLAQREVDGRAVNFYRKGFGMPARRPLPLLAMKLPEAPLVSLAFRLAGDPDEHHAVLTAVGGRAFCLSFDADMRPFAAKTDITAGRVAEAWRSNF